MERRWNWKLVTMCVWLSALFHQAVLQQDVVFINRTEDFCVDDDPQYILAGLSVNVTDNGEACIRWRAVNESSLSLENVTAYELLYWSRATTTYNSRVIPDTSSTGLFLDNLTPFTSYSISVRLYCGGEVPQYGPASPSVQFTTPSKPPGVAVSNIAVDNPYNGSERDAKISWDPIPTDQWNGQPYGYWVSIQPDSRANGSRLERVIFPSTMHLAKNLADGLYTVVIQPANSDFAGPSNQTTFRIGDPPEPSSESTESFFDSLYVYILVPGVVLVAAIVVFTVVLFKTTCEKRRGVAYCKDIHEKMNGNVLPLQIISPIPSSLSPHSITSSWRRPLPLSPTSESSPTIQLIPEGEHVNFGAGRGATPPARKQPHPGGIPLLKEAQPGFPIIPMQRTRTSESSGSVFTTAQVHVHPTQRSRAKAVGDSMPSPYEVPADNGSTLSRSDVPQRPNTATGIAHMQVQIPPPPSHAPPPLTISSLEIFAAHRNQSFPATDMPSRGMQNRSFSTTAADHLGETRAQMRPMRSTGQIPLDPAAERGGDKMVYIRPLDSSLENSVYSAGSSGGYQHEGRNNLERGTRPPISHPNAAVYTGQMNGSVITTASEYSSYSEMTDPNSIPGTAPQTSILRMPTHPPPSHHPSGGIREERGLRAGRRESEFSDMSTEMSVSSMSGSIRGLSPPDVDRRVTHSDVGRAQRSRSPDVRDYLSDIGVPTQRAFRQNHSPAHPHPVPYTSPTSIISSAADSLRV